MKAECKGHQRSRSSQLIYSFPERVVKHILSFMKTQDSCQLYIHMEDTGEKQSDRLPFIFNDS